jgi:hypothetical protein
LKFPSKRRIEESAEAGPVARLHGGAEAGLVKNQLALRLPEKKAPKQDCHDHETCNRGNDFESWVHAKEIG